ncbi:hypothetical protein M5689_002219 [Euphorbia peplus]|nr:hypothetical protein M5689_002219 [Euphorbia peplus]
MKSGINSMNWFLITLLSTTFLFRVCAVCELSFLDGNKVYNFSLMSALPKYPHGVLSEDGFYKVAENESVLWFQLCDGMIFNHNPPTCVECLECGGPSHCGMECSALMANNIEGYDVCTTIGHVSNTITQLIDKQDPAKGVVVKMSSTVKKSTGSEMNCSLSVSVLCNSNGVQGPNLLEKLGTGTCDYATVLQHPAGCATILFIHGKGLGWFSVLVIIILCLFGAYLMAGTVFRYFFLGIRGVDIVPNMEFWATIPRKTESFFASLVRKFRGPTEVHRSSYSPVDF